MCQTGTLNICPCTLTHHVQIHTHTHTHTSQFEYLRLTSLGVIGAFVKVDDPEVIRFLLQTEIIPLCLKIMDSRSDLSKTVATFILQRILLDDTGLSYICHTFERFNTVSNALRKMVLDRPSWRLLKHVIRCYLRVCVCQRKCTPAVCVYKRVCRLSFFIFIIIMHA
jgi:CCR4-NOT transcription complex subunit 9